MIAVHNSRNAENVVNDGPFSSSVEVGTAHASPHGRTTERVEGNTDRPRTRGTEGDLRYRATTRAVSRYQHVVVNRERKQRDTGKEVANNRPGDPEWRATYPATRRLSDRAPFATALSGLDPDRVSGSDYEWLVP